MAPLLWLARAFSSAPVALLEDDEITHDHDMLELIRKPNAHYSGRVLWMATLISIFFDGNAYWRKIRGTRREIKELWYIPHWMIDEKADNEYEYISRYKYTVGGRREDIDPEDIVHFRYGLDPENIRKGFAPLKTLLREIFTDEEAANFVASILENGGVPGVIISPEGEGNIPPQDVEDVKRYVGSQFTGDSRGQPFVLGSPTKVEQFGWDPQKLNLGTLRNVSEERVCAIIGIPAAVVGFGTGIQQTKVGATLKELRASAWEDTIIPLQGLIAEDLQNQLLTEYETDSGRYGVTFDTSQVRALQEDENKKVERLNTAVQGGWLRVDRAQAMAGWEVDENQALYLRKVATLEVPAAEKIRDGSNGRSKELKRLELKTDAGERAQRLYEQLDSDWERLSETYQGELTERFDAFGEQAKELYLEQMERRGLAAVDPPQTKDIIDEIVGSLIIEDLLSSTGKAELLKYKEHYIRTATQTVGTLNAVFELGVNLTDEMEAKLVTQGGTRMGLVDLDEQTKEALFDAIAEGREAGEGPQQIAARIKDQVAAGPWRNSRIRAEIIARAETKYAQNVSSMEAYKQAENVRYIQIFDARKNEPHHPRCLELDGQIVTIEEAEGIDPLQHPNCSRSFAPYIPEPGEGVPQVPLQTAGEQGG
jgi:HK97 family phage portal protein